MKHKCNYACPLAAVFVSYEHSSWVHQPVSQRFSCQSTEACVQLKCKPCQHTCAVLHSLISHFSIEVEAFTAYRSRIKISQRSICHSPYLSHHSQKRRLECSPVMLYGTREAAVMVAADVQIAFLAWEMNPRRAKFIKALIECRWLPCLFVCVSYCRSGQCYLEIYGHRRGVCRRREGAYAAVYKSTNDVSFLMFTES